MWRKYVNLSQIKCIWFEFFNKLNEMTNDLQKVISKKFVDAKVWVTETVF